MNLVKYDKSYCAFLRIKNPYSLFHHRLSPKIPKFDQPAFDQNPKHQFVYDKLFIAKSQGMKCGELAELAHAGTAFPVFIKPRYGHQTASSRDCYKITTSKELAPHMKKPNMMWSEFVDATEGMTDFVLVQGQIVYQLSYVYSKKQNGFADDWKYVSPDTKPPVEVVQWVLLHMAGYTGAVNVQYRDVKIIEVGLRFARSGMYLESTDNADLINAINQVPVSGTWDHKNDDKLAFAPFFSFKCWSPTPVCYLLPQYVLDGILYAGGSMPFYEYYFEPTGTHNLIFFQFMHRDFEKGMQLKRVVEQAMLVSNILVVVLLLSGVFLYVHSKQGAVLVFALLLLSTTLFNSLEIIYKMVKNQSQFVL
jgi:hypothetical protein